jgi:hypothetical protein
MHLIAALLLVLHGIAHLVGFRSAFWPTAVPVARRSERFRKLEGVTWVLLALAFMASGALLVLGHPSWSALLLLSTSGSLVMCFLAWPEARIGLFVDVVLLLLVLLLVPSTVGSSVMAALAGGIN